jgi:2-keto-4-pentenoate hydratase/2-oxohepta-3-ene-1,7-dioic acid hydratase in catechol pathway
MKLRRVNAGDDLHVELLAPQGWVDVAKCLAALGQRGPAQAPTLATQIVELLGAPAELRAAIMETAKNLDPVATAEANVVIPFEPRSFRDFMLYESHAVAAARGFVRTQMPAVFQLVRAFEALTGGTFPKLKPHALWYRQPIYYMGNHLTFATDGEAVAVPSYARALDYELELGFVLALPLRDAAPETAEAAIGGFVVLNDFTARNAQLGEMASGFGPQKSKHFRSALSNVIVTADEILPRWRALQGFVRLNGTLLAEPSTAGARWSLGEVLAHASRAEQLYPGELFGTGTLPGGSGVETGHELTPGDRIEIGITGIGTLANPIV